MNSICLMATSENVWSNVKYYVWIQELEMNVKIFDCVCVMYKCVLVNCKPNKITLQLYVHKHVDKFTPEFLKNL